jgi:hypothetical protein
MIAWSASERERCADFGVTLRQDFGVSAQSNAQGGDAQSNAAKRRSLFQPNQNRCRATLAETLAVEILAIEILAVKILGVKILVIAFLPNLLAD